MSKKAGKPIDELSMRDEIIRADMGEVVRVYCLQHSAKIVDAIMTRFQVLRKPIGE